MKNYLKNRITVAKGGERYKDIADNLSAVVVCLTNNENPNLNSATLNVQEAQTLIIRNGGEGRNQEYINAKVADAREAGKQTLLELYEEKDTLPEGERKYPWNQGSGQRFSVGGDDVLLWADSTIFKVACWSKSEWDQEGKSNADQHFWFNTTGRKELDRIAGTVVKTNARSILLNGRDTMWASNAKHNKVFRHLREDVKRTVALKGITVFTENFVYDALEETLPEQTGHGACGVKPRRRCHSGMVV